MTNQSGQRAHVNLHEIARQAMKDKGLDPDFSPAIEQEVRDLGGPAHEQVKDLTKLLWFSIDNDDSRDLDQLSYAEPVDAERTRVYVAVADVDACVKIGSAIDTRARNNTTSVYTAGGVFPMLPEQLSTDWTSLNEGVDRLALVFEYVVEKDGSTSQPSVYRALVHNYAQLAYNNVAEWYDGKGELPKKLDDMKLLEENIRLQIKASDRLRELRHEHGALELQTIEAKPVFVNGEIVDLKVELKNEAKELIEDFMIAANGVVAVFLDQKKFPVFRRVVKTPERWTRIVELATQYGEQLPPDADSAALEEFLVKRRKADPLRFPDLSLAIVKLLGRGEYVIDPAGAEPVGHFGLAVRDYSHSTAPNRRYPDLITHRMLKAAVGGTENPYSLPELDELATHCTERENDATKVERMLRKCAAAVVLSNRIGQRFDGLITGASDKGTWVRIFQPPAEGRIDRGAEGLDVGDKVSVKLVHVDPERGFIDFTH